MDEGEVVARSLVETGLSDCVVAYQRFAEQQYFALEPARPSRNVFQRLQDGSALWRGAVGEGYEDWLEGQELKRLRVLFQRRHLLQHTDGIVDQQYILRSGDESYKVGQRIIVTAEDILDLADLVEKLAGAIRERVARLEQE